MPGPLNTHRQTERRAAYVLILILAFLAAGIVTAGYLYYRNYEKQYRAEVEGQLSAIAGLKVGELAQFRKERLADAAVLFRNVSFSALIRRFLENPGDADAQHQIQAWIGKYQAQYDRVYLLDTRGATRMSAPAAPEPVDAIISRRASEILRSELVTLQDFYRNEHNQRIYLAVLVPIFDERNGGRPLGVVVLRIDPETYLYPFISHWPIPSRTAETLLIRRDGNDALFLNEPRFRTNTALNLRVPLTKLQRTSVQAVLGREGIVEGPDYRGVPVIGYVGQVPDSPWFLVARVDTSEVNAPVRERWWEIVGLGGLLLAGAAGATGSVWRRQNMRVYRERYRAAEALRETKDYLENLINHANAPIVVWDPQFRITRFNRAFESLTGLPAGDVMGRSLEILFPPGQAGATMEMLRKTLAGERLETVEIDILHTGGPVRTVLWNSATIFASGGKTPVATIAQGQDITERKRQERELQQKNEELARFTYTVSHDLKSPLVTIKTFLGYLELDARNQDAARMDKDLGYIRGAADKMSRLLDELLQLSRVGRKMNPFVDAPLEAVVQEALDLVAGRIAARGVTVRLTGEPVLLHGDRPRLVDVLQNLVDNAVKFLGEQPAPVVEIGAEPAGGEMVIYVRDNGIGIDPRHQHKLFGLFEKLNSGAEGTGIGLALARRIVEVHGGRIWVESAGLGQGATFRFTLAQTKRQPADKENVP
ncbi:MAG: ATP-binding protein [Bryobacterales bacterium]|nr:ATP-binding protein [Bryobacterales bacterium]